MEKGKVTRRGLLSFLGMGAAATAAAGMTMGVDAGKDRTAFRYVCDCGEGMVAEVPAAENESVSLKCKCGVMYTLTWLGDHFSVKSDAPEKEYSEEAWPSSLPHQEELTRNIGEVQTLAAKRASSFEDGSEEV